MYLVIVEFNCPGFFLYDKYIQIIGSIDWPGITVMSNSLSEWYFRKELMELSL